MGDLTDIRARAEAATYRGGTEQEVADDLLTLLAEVEQLRFEVSVLQATARAVIAAGEAYKAQVQAVRAVADDAVAHGGTILHVNHVLDALDEHLGSDDG